MITAERIKFRGRLKWRFAPRALVSALCVLALLAPIPAIAGVTLATGFPKAYWPLQEKYEAALGAGDPAAIVETGVAITSLFLSGASPSEKAKSWAANGDTAIIEMIYPVFLNVAEAKEKLGDYPKTAQAFKDVLPMAEAYKPLAKNPSDMDFAITETKNKITKYGSSIDLYIRTDTPSQSFHNAKFEPKTGMYYGEAYELGSNHERVNKKLASLGKKASGSLFYVAYETEKMSSFDWVFKRLEKEYDIIEVAWNLRKENASLKQVLNDRAKIEEAVKYLSGLNVKVLLRFGAEMNVWQDLASPKDYIAAYQFVAGIARKNSSNIALLWSPNSISAQGASYEDYYPGDEYVDWVGVSHYTMKYFNGNKNQDETTQAIYGTGSYADPVMQAAEIVEKYGAKKPIALSECGVENYSVANQENVNGWAENKMRALYAYLPMVYPQVKAIFYYDSYFSGAKCRFSLHDNEKMNNLYAELTADPYFLEKGKDGAGSSWRKASPDGITVNAGSARLVPYAPFYSLSGLTVTYTLDGIALAVADDLPYAKALDFSSYKDGEYKLSVEAKSGGQVVGSVAANLKKAGGNVTLSK